MYDGWPAQKLADVNYLSGRPLPVAPDGRYDSEVQPLTGTIVRADPHSDLYKTVRSLSGTVKNLPLITTELFDPQARRRPPSLGRLATPQHRTHPLTAVYRHMLP